MKGLLLFTVLNISMISESFAFTCQATDNSGQAVSITVNEKNVAIKLADAPIVKLPISSSVWDGHASGFITADGVAIKYDNHYGCIRNVVITGLLKRDGRGHITTVEMAGCKGGSTPDDLCFRD
jgi:hypothetical protein